MGSRFEDPNMVPLARRRVDFGTLLPPGHPIHMTVRVSHNRQVEFAFSTDFHGQALQGHLEVLGLPRLGVRGRLELGLPDVNRPAAGGSWR